MIHNVSLAVAVILAGFIFWKRGTEEHFQEDVLFDGFLLSTFAGLIVGRIAHVVLNFSSFGWSVPQWINLWSHPGISLSFAVLGAVLFLIRFARSKGWDGWMTLDMWFPGIALGSAVAQIGFAIQLLLEKRELGSVVLVSSLVGAFILLLLSRYFYWLEFRYRTFSWYKSGQDLAKSGFITGVGLFSLGTLAFILHLLQQGFTTNVGTVVYGAFYGCTMLIGVMMVLVRSGKLSLSKKRK